MAIAFVARGGNASKTSGTTLDVTSFAASVADTIFVLFASDDAAGTYSCASSHGTFTEESFSPVTSAGNVVLRYFRCRVTTGGTATITVTHPTLTARAMQVIAFSGVDATPFDTSSTNTGSSGTPTSNSATPSVNDCLLLGAVGIEGPSDDAVFTQATGFDNVGSPVRQGTTGGGATSNITIAGGYIIQTTLAADAYDPTITSRDWAAAIAVYKPTAAAATSLIRRPHRFHLIRR